MYGIGTSCSAAVTALASSVAVVISLPSPCPRPDSRWHARRAAAMPVGVALIGIDGPEHPRLGEGPAGDLEPDGQAVGIAPARRADRGQAEIVERACVDGDGHELLLGAGRAMVDIRVGQR